MNKQLTALRLTASVLAIWIAAPAFAQADAAPQPAADAVADDSVAGDIVVTAQRRSERAVDVPATITVITSAKLTVGSNTNNLNLTYFSPGTKIDRVGLNVYPAIRGITSLVSGPGFDANVATYIDGVYASNPAAIIDLPDVDNVVVLKGPQGTLFGRNATGGAIQIKTRRPSYDLAADASLGYGSLNDFSAKAFVSVPVIADKLAISLAGYHETRDGYLYDIVSKKKTGDFKAELLRGKILFNPTENVELLLSGYLSYHSDPAGTAGTPFAGSSQANLQPGAITASQPYQVARNIESIERTRGRGLDLHLKIDGDIGTITAIGAYSRGRTYVANPAYGGFAPAGGYLLYVYQTDRSYSGEVNLTTRDFGPFNFITGYYRYDDVAAYDPLQIRPDVPTPRQISLFGYQKSRADAVYGETNIHLTDKLTATAGIRYSAERREVTGNVSTGLIREPATAVRNYGHVNFSAWTPRFSLRYEIANRTNAYFTYSRGFKSGGYDVTGVLSGNPATGLTPVLPEKVDAYELGFKTSSRLFDLSASAFYYDYKNQQVTAYANVGGVVLGVTNNAAASKIYGADVEAGLNLTDELRLTTGISLIHARFKDYQRAVVNILDPSGPFGLIQTERDVKGNRLPRTPDWTISLGGQYRKEFSAGTLTLNADLFVSDKFYFDAGNIFTQPRYENLDASASWTLPGDRFKFTVWGKNLTDQVIVLGTNIGARSALYSWAPPRTYGATVGVKF